MRSKAFHPELSLSCIDNVGIGDDIVEIAVFKVLNVVLFGNENISLGIKLFGGNEMEGWTKIFSAGCEV